MWTLQKSVCFLRCCLLCLSEIFETVHSDELKWVFYVHFEPVLITIPVSRSQGDENMKNYPGWMQLFFLLKANKQTKSIQIYPNSVYPLVQYSADSWLDISFTITILSPRLCLPWYWLLQCCEGCHPGSVRYSSILRHI